MSVVSLLFSIGAGFIAAGVTWLGTGTLWAAFSAYSLVGASALVLSMTISGYVQPVRLSARSLRTRELS